jgi:hypothetical protein
MLLKIQSNGASSGHRNAGQAIRSRFVYDSPSSSRNACKALKTIKNGKIFNILFIFQVESVRFLFVPKLFGGLGR